jgi:hypothetical protein
MPTLHAIFAWFTSGSGRLASGAALFLVMWVLKSVPAAKLWLDVDSTYSPFGKTIKLTSGQKKAMANVVLAMTPTAVALTTTTLPLHEILTTTVASIVTGAGIHSLVKATGGK